MNIAVVDTEYHRISAGRAFIRYILKNIVLSVVPSIISYCSLFAAIFIVGFNGNDSLSYGAYRSTITMVLLGSILLTIIYYIVIFAIIGYTKRKQAPYDMLSRTLVVDRRSLP